VASRPIVAAVGWARERTTVGVSGARWATVRAVGPSLFTERPLKRGSVTCGPPECRR
jgi:hypothetical protein